MYVKVVGRYFEAEWSVGVSAAASEAVAIDLKAQKQPPVLS